MSEVVTICSEMQSIRWFILKYPCGSWAFSSWGGQLYPQYFFWFDLLEENPSWHALPVLLTPFATVGLVKNDMNGSLGLQNMHADHDVVTIPSCNRSFLHCSHAVVGAYAWPKRRQRGVLWLYVLCSEIEGNIRHSPVNRTQEPDYVLQLRLR